MKPSPGRVLLCHVADDDRLPRDFAGRLAAAAGVAVGAVEEVHGLAAAVLAPDESLRALFDAPAIWIGCRRPRAVRALLARAHIRLAPGATQWLASGDGERKARAGKECAPWYPAIDPERCRNCDQCRQFCLFGVYARDAKGRVTVAKPLACKPGCPACARLCPAQAIIFPFCPESPINGDQPPNAAPAEAGALRARLGDNPLAALAARRARAIAPERLEQALQERALRRDKLES
jgi:NAD-dependent dihydropyrimidine dehydrogenase PreA subunit